MWPLGSTSFTPLSCSGLWEAVITIPVAAPLCIALKAISTPHLQEPKGHWSTEDIRAAFKPTVDYCKGEDGLHLAI